MNLQERLEFGDALLFLYFLVFVRQYFWLIENNALAWALSLAVTAVGWYVYLRTKQFPAAKFGLSFWLVVGLPLLALYLLRAAFPDHSFDVLSYHLLNAERTLQGPLFRPDDFFPSLPFNPAPDTLFGISRTLLGYRLGTVLNLLALLWAAQIVDKILRPLVSRSWLRSTCVLLVVLAESFLFEISTYMVDLLALPLMLEATYLTLRANEAKNHRLNLIHIALLLGASAAFKFTNLAVVLPLALVCTYKALRWRWFTPKQIATTFLFTVIAFLAPLLPFAIYMYGLTGNPIFPIANVFFKSPYWPTHGGWDARWGSQTFWEIIIWPVLSWFKPERHSELAVYSGRLALGSIVALLGLMTVWRNVAVRTLCFVLLTSALLWSAAGLGYGRYGFYQEMLAGLTVIAVAAALSGVAHELKFSWKTGLALVILIALVGQAVVGLHYVRQREWGGRTTVIADGYSYARNARFMLRDRTLANYLTADARSSVDGVSVWLETCPQSTGFQAFLNPNAPIIAARQAEYFFTREARRQFVRKVEELPGRMFSLCLKEYLDSAKQAIAARGLEVGGVTPIEIPFFSPYNRLGMVLIEVLRPQTAEARQNFQSSWMNAAFPDADYVEEITAVNAPAEMRPGEKVTIRFKVKNLGGSTWPAVGNKEGRYQVNIGDRWLSADGSIEINGLDGRTAMLADLPPGKEVELPLSITAPDKPGDYIVEVDMVHEGVTWFFERGARPLRLRMRVAP